MLGVLWDKMLNEEAQKLKEQLLVQLSKLPQNQAANIRESIEAMSAEEIEDFVVRQRQAAQKGGKCLFCQITKGEVETIKVYEDENILAVLDIAPAALGHTIVIPKQHYQFLFQLPGQLLSNLLKVVNLLEEIVVNVTKSHGINIHVAQGIAAGQTVPHLAVHLIPRREKDGISFEWVRKKIEKKELEKVGKEIKERIEKATEKKEEEAIALRKEEEKSEAEQMLRHYKERVP